MIISPPAAREYLRACDLHGLFIDQLGWENPETRRLTVTAAGRDYCLDGVAHKRGLAVFLCRPDAQGAIPDYTTRRAIEKAVAAQIHEHIIVYADAVRSRQIWQWVRREPGKPDACREHVYYQGQHGEALLQRLHGLAIDMEEEEALTIVDVAGRARRAFDVDRVTKRFYDRFQTEHSAFLRFVTGIQSEADRAWYASLMLNRLMFVYFIQKKGFLDGDRDYLRNRLRTMQARGSRDAFHSFYRHFLLRLFHEGLGRQTRSSELDALLGQVPYLNGGLFDVHLLERDNANIEIPDEAFERIFAFFDAYQWHLDERPLRADNEINPDVLGYIFEKYINQKQMGAYYTKEDITAYIGTDTIIPWLMEAAREKCAIAFRPDGALWGLLRDDPDRYIYASIKSAEYLPTETAREYQARRRRYAETRARLAAGEVTAIDDLITLNLDLRQFAQDAIEQCEGPELLRAFYGAISALTVLDPTVGSGAFLFAALNILQPLYDACLDRMRGFVDDLDHAAATPSSSRKFSDFRELLARVEDHPSREYFILKSIIIGNLYGVDIMEEAVEICKLRLFLKLVAQVERVEEVEPLPDVDFNIRAGNTLVGFASYEEARAAVTRKLDFDNAMGRIDENAEIADRAFRMFRAMQTAHGLDAEQFSAAKRDLHARLDALRHELDRYLAGEYGTDAGDAEAFAAWRASHQPFHWFVEFYGIMKRGGFDVVIGNPPWKEYAAVRREYRVRNYVTESCGNLHGICTERAINLRARQGRSSFIVQLPLASSSRMSSVRDLLKRHSDALYVLTFDDRPGKLFEGLENCRSVIFLSKAQMEGRSAALATTRYQRWPTAARPHLFELIEYARVLEEPIYPGLFPKYSNAAEESLFRRVKASGKPLSSVLSARPTEHFIFYQEATRYWVKATVGLPYYAKDGVVGAPAHGRYLYCGDENTAYIVGAILNSSLFYAYFIAFGDCFHLSDGLATGFPVAPGIVADTTLVDLSKRLMADLNARAELKSIHTSDGHEISYAEFYASRSKPIIDEIDRVLARHYGFTDEELDFIVNYDIKYRMGQDQDTENGE